MSPPSGLRSQRFQGDLAEAVIYNRVLNSAENQVIENYLSGTSPDCPRAICAGMVSTAVRSRSPAWA